MLNTYSTYSKRPPGGLYSARIPSVFHIFHGIREYGSRTPQKSPYSVFFFALTREFTWSGLHACMAGGCVAGWAGPTHAGPRTELAGEARHQTQPLTFTRQRPAFEAL